ncbi:MAG TPA: hypothetical protein DHW14_00290 [Clostridiales bacterium]|nr:hypothetical protein [Clostridiales bacterium]
MELRALQAQINPHFLFNTLSSIAASSFMEGAPKTHELVQALARLLRYTLRQIGQMVELEEELKHVKDYLLIEETRFGDRIKFEFDIDPHSLRARLPLLTLQPLVENAIIHGLEPKDGGTLRVSSRLVGDWVRIQVTDDGVGLDDDPAEAQEGADPDRSRVSHVTGLGLDNVRRRLEHAFGEGADLDIRSRRGEGTVVTVTIPAPVRGPGSTREEGEA